MKSLPSNAAATLLFRVCVASSALVASNALAVAAAEGGLLVVILPETLHQVLQKSPCDKSLGIWMA